MAVTPFEHRRDQRGRSVLPHTRFGKAEPINTFNGWKAIERHVKRGEKAIQLLMPIFQKVKDEVTGEKKEGALMFFAPKKYWFSLSQTEGKDYTPVIPGFDFDKMLVELKITQEPFECMNGSCMGYAKPKERKIAVSPVAYDPPRTKIHETSHLVLEHGQTSQHPENDVPTDAREGEAELTTHIVLSSLGFTDNLNYSRGYLQNWVGPDTAKEIRFPKVFSAADTILKAGRLEPIRPHAPQAEAPELVA